MSGSAGGAVLEAAGGIRLQRASTDDRDAVKHLQFTAYAANRERLGVEPVPLLADYSMILRCHEVWARPADPPREGLSAVLILATSGRDDVLIWSLATSPVAQRRGLGHALLQCAEARARQIGRDTLRLYTGKKLIHLVDWYARNGYEVERIEELSDRSLVHMFKKLA